MKSNQLLKYEFGSSKKLKCSSDDLAKELSNIERERQRLERERIKYAEREKNEKLLKLKSMVAEPPAKEVVVQTSKGVLKFEGISRKFTRKLYEWEKARGIGPEASTFALLHPGYRPLVVGNGEGDSDTGTFRILLIISSVLMFTLRAQDLQWVDRCQWTAYHRMRRYHRFPINHPASR